MGATGSRTVSAESTASTPARSPRRNPLRRLADGPPMLRHALVGLVVLLVVIALIAASAPFVQGQLASLAYMSVAAAGLTVLTGLSGQLSLGHGAFMAIGAYTAALLLPSSTQQAPIIVVLAAATLVALVVGIVVGLAAARLHGPYLAGATLALAVAVPGLAIYFADVFGGEQGLNVSAPLIPRWFDDALFFVTGRELTNMGFLANLAWIVLVVVLVLLANLASGRTGRQWRAVRDDEVAASLAGIDLGRSRVLAFIVSAAAAGLAGALLAMATRIVAPAGFTLTLSLGLLAAIVLGGLGTLSGAVIGSAIIVLLPQLATSVGSDLGLSDLQAAELAPLAYGLTTMLVILLAPQGLVGTVRTAWLRRRGAAAAAPSTPTERENTHRTDDTPDRAANDHGRTHDERMINKETT